MQWYKTLCPDVMWPTASVVALGTHGKHTCVMVGKSRLETLYSAGEMGSTNFSKKEQNETEL